MKKICLLLMSGLVLMFFANCGKKDDSQKGSADMSAMCYQLQSYGQTYANGNCTYNYSGITGGVFTNYGQQNPYQPTAAFGGVPMGTTGGCPAQTAPVYSATKGLGCVNNTAIQYSGQPALYALNTSTNTFITVSAPNVNNLYAGQNMWTQTGSQPGYQPQAYQQQFGMNGMMGMNGMYGMNGMNGMNGQTVYRACEENDKCPDTQSCRPPIPNVASRLGICYHN